jgi:hypothetical protein
MAAGYEFDGVDCYTIEIDGPVDLIELGAELIKAGTTELRTRS